MHGHAGDIPADYNERELERSVDRLTELLSMACNDLKRHKLLNRQELQRWKDRHDVDVLTRPSREAEERERKLFNARFALSRAQMDLDALKGEG